MKILQCQERLLENIKMHDEPEQIYFRHKAFCMAKCNLTQVTTSHKYFGFPKEKVLAEREKKHKKDILMGCERYCPVKNKERWEDINNNFNITYEKKRRGE